MSAHHHQTHFPRSYRFLAFSYISYHPKKKPLIDKARVGRIRLKEVISIFQNFSEFSNQHSWTSFNEWGVGEWIVFSFLFLVSIAIGIEIYIKIRR